MFDTVAEVSESSAAGLPPPKSPSPNTPSRDAEVRARLRAVAARAQPFVAAGDRRLPVSGLLGELLPTGGVQRGSTIAVDGCAGSGSTTVALTLAAAATAAGEWAAVVDPDGTLGARCAAEAGVVLERLAVVRRAPPDRWGAVVAALLDGITVVVAAVPPHVRLGDARRLVARAPASAVRCSSRSAHGRSRLRCGCTPARADGAASERVWACWKRATSMSASRRKAADTRWAG